MKNFPEFIVIHRVKGFGIVNKAEIDVFPIPEDRAKGMPSALVPSHTPQASRATEPRALDNRTDHLPAGLGGTSLVRSEFPFIMTVGSQGPRIREPSLP